MQDVVHLESKLNAAEKALRESEEKYKNIIENIEDGYFEVDIAGNFTFFNRSMSKILGYSKDELIGLNNRRYMDAENAKKVFDAFNSVYKTRRPYKGFDWELIRKDGSKCYVETSVALKLDLKGNPIGFQGIARDITTRKQAELALEYELEFQRVLGEISNRFINISSMAIDEGINGALQSAGEFVAADRSYAIKFDFQAGTITNTHEWCRAGIEPQLGNLQDVPIEMFGWVIEQLVNLKVVCIPKVSELPPEASTAKDDFDAEGIQSLLLVPLVSEASCFGTVGFDFVKHERPCTDREIKLLQMLGATLSSVLDRKQMEETLRENEEKYKSLANNLNVGLYRNTIGSMGKFIEANPAIVEMFGFDSKEDFLGVSVSDLYVNPEERKRYNSKLLEKGAVKNEELQLKKKDGSSFIGSISAVVVKDEKGDVKYYDGIIEDVTERKRIEEDLHNSEERFRNVYETAPLAFVVWDKTSRVIDWNKKAQAIFGWSREEVVGKYFFNFLIPEKDRPHVEEIVSSLLKGTLSNHSMNKNLTKNGELITCEWNNSALHDDNGNIIGAISLGLDITERVRAAEALRKNEEKYRNLYSNAQVGLARTRISDGKILMSNEKLAKIFGYENTQDFIDEYFFSENYVDPDKREKMLEKVKISGAISNEEAEFYAKDKSKVWVRFDTRIYPDKGYMEDVIIDITESRIAEEAQRKSEAKYRSMMESMVDPIYICSPDFRVEYANPVMIERVGRDVTGEVCYRALHGLDRQCDWCTFNKVSEDKPIETKILSPLDNRTYRVTNMPIPNEDGSISKMTIYRDITDFIAAVDEKNKARAQLMQAQKMESIGNLAGGIAHDFNNILTSILGFTEISLEDVETGSGLEKNLLEVYAAGERAKELVKQILAIARQSGEELKPLKIDAIVQELMKFIRSSIPTTIEIKEDLESDSITMGNTTQVHQILMNLCTNAAHAMEDEGGILEVSVKDVQVFGDSNLKDLNLSPGKYIRLDVSDTGVGIAPEIIDSIFEPYFTTKGPGEGTGMGLALVHGIVESYGGKITVDSTRYKGSTFSIYLPVTRERLAQQPDETEEFPAGNERILLVDDEVDIVTIGSQILERLGYTVTPQTGSLEALELFRARSNDFDLIITDMTMPNITGDKLAIEMMKIRSDIPIILCTGYSNKISKEKAKEIGLKAFAYKPVITADLAKTVRKVLDEAKATAIH